MSDRCVACGEVAEGKPLYKKLGSSDCETEVFKALHEMQLLSLPLGDMNNHYICWDCDETIAEEYAMFVSSEAKRKAFEEKRKKQDVARNIKLNKKLKMAFKKAHADKLRARGLSPPSSKYKMKEREREENRYHASHCILCKCSFEDDEQGRGFQQFALTKMVDDEFDVATILQRMQFSFEFPLTDEVKRKRFICGQCYNKIRRSYKSQTSNENSFSVGNNNQSTEKSGDIFRRRPTAEEHAAEIAKLIPPSLANLYKVVTEDEKLKNNNNHHGNSKASSSSSEDDLSTKPDFPPQTNSVTTVKRGFVGISASRAPPLRPPPVATLNSKESREVVDLGVCNLCGLEFHGKTKSFWQTLSSPVPSVAGVTVADALTLLDSSLADAGPVVRKKQLICNPCYSRVCTGFRSQILQRIALKKGIDVNKIDMDSLKVKVMDPSSPSEHLREKVNGSVAPAELQDKDRSSRKKNKKRDKHKKDRYHHHRENSPPSRQFRFSHNYNNAKNASDLELIKIINKACHLQYKGKQVKLYSGSVNVANIEQLIPYSAFGKVPVRLEFLREAYQYTNFCRNLKNKGSWSICILCQKTKVGLRQTTHWLDDPVAPPNLMVPIRWAYLSLGQPKIKANLALEDGKVCHNCYNSLRGKFRKFVGTKVAHSHGLSSEKITLDKYKVSFDSVAMNIVADPLESKHQYREDKYYNKKSAVHTDKQSSIKNLNVYNGKLVTTASELIKNKNVSFANSPETRNNVSNNVSGTVPSEPLDTVSMDLELSETSDSEDESNSKQKSTSTEDKVSEKKVDGECHSGICLNNSDKINGISKELTANSKGGKNLQFNDDLANKLKVNDDTETTVAEGGSVVNRMVVDKQSIYTTEQTKIQDKSEAECTVDNEAFTTRTVNKEAITPSTVDKEAVTGSIVDEETVTASTVDKEAVTASTVNKEAVTASTVNKEAVTASTVDEEAVTASTADKEAVTASTADKEAVTASTADKEAVTASTADKEAVTASTADKEAVTASTVGKEAVTASTVDEMTVTASTVDKEAVTASNVDKDTVTKYSVDTEIESTVHTDALVAAKDKDASIAELVAAGAPNVIVNNAEASLATVEKSLANDEVSVKEHSADVRTTEKSDETSDYGEQHLASNKKPEPSETHNGVMIDKKLETPETSDYVTKDKKSETFESIDRVTMDKKAEIAETSDVLTKNSLKEPQNKSGNSDNNIGMPPSPQSSSVLQTDCDLNNMVEDEVLSESNLSRSKENENQFTEAVSKAASVAHTNGSRKELAGQMAVSSVENHEGISGISSEPRSNVVRHPRHYARRGRKRKRTVPVITRRNCDKSLSELIDKEKASSYSIITDYLNAQRDKMRELINPTLLEAPKQASGNGGGKINEEVPFPASQVRNEVTCSVNPGPSILSMEPDYSLESMGKDMVAPFAQRKKCRRPHPDDLSQDAEKSAEQGLSSCILSIWQTLQGISIDDLLTKDVYQPLRISQYNIGLVLALNDMRVHIGAPLEDLVTWLKKLQPLEWQDKGIEPCIEKFSGFLFSLSQSNEALDLSRLKEVLSEDLFVSVSRDAIDTKKIECFLEDVMDSPPPCLTPRRVKWQNFLAMVNMDDLLMGKECRVSWNNFNNGLLYALWRVNKLIDGDESNLRKWLSLTSTAKMKEDDYVTMAHAGAAMHSHLEKYPEEIDKLIAPIVVKSEKQTKYVNMGPKCDDGVEKVVRGKVTQPSRDATTKTTPHSRSKQIKRPADNSDIGRPQKKLARVAPQKPKSLPQQGVTPSQLRKFRKLKFNLNPNELTAKQSAGATVPNLTTKGSKVASSQEDTFRHRKDEQMKIKEWSDDDSVISNSNEKDSTLPIISKVISGAAMDPQLAMSLIDKNVNFNIHNHNVNINPLSLPQNPAITFNLQHSVFAPLLPQQTLTTAHSPTAKFPFMISPTGFMPVTYNFSGVTIPDTSYKDNDLQSKVIALERQLQEIQKQNSKLLELNQTLLSKAGVDIVEKSKSPEIARDKPNSPSEIVTEKPSSSSTLWEISEPPSPETSFGKPQTANLQLENDPLDVEMDSLDVEIEKFKPKSPSPEPEPENPAVDGCGLDAYKSFLTTTPSDSLEKQKKEKLQ